MNGDERPRWYTRPCAVCARPLLADGLMIAAIRRGEPDGAIEILNGSLTTCCTWRCVAAWATAQLVEETPP